MEIMPERFFLATDISSHWYVVPESKRDDWEKFEALDDDDEASWFPPSFATPLGGSPANITFCDWKRR